MTEFVLVGCTKSKRDGVHPARSLYGESALFRKRRWVARQRGDRWSILSAKHGLLLHEEPVDYYDVHISDRDSEEWADQVLDRLLPTLAMSQAETVTIFAGSKYVDPLVPELEAEGYEVLDPLRGLRPGERMSALDDMASELAEVPDA